MSMSSKLGSALVASTLLLIAGCGGQAATSSQSSSSSQSARPGQATKSTFNVRHQKPARRYLVKRAQKAEDDNEGPEKPIAGSNPRWSYHVVLTATNAGPRAASSSTAARVTLRGHRVCWRFGALPSSFSSSAAFGRVRKNLNPTSAQIHVGAKGKTGPVVVVFGPRYKPAGCIVVRPVVVNAIASAAYYYYLNVVTAKYPKGALRAQL